MPAQTARAGYGFLKFLRIGDAISVVRVANLRISETGSEKIFLVYV